MVTVDGMEVVVHITAASVINPEKVSRLPAPGSPDAAAVAHVIVGDLITGPARQALNDAGWGWFDRRGHVMLRAKGVHIDADVPTDERPARESRPDPISGAAAISWSAALLMAPEHPPSMREVARQVSLSHSAIVAAAKRLREASLVRADGRPLVPELFWALADKWTPPTVALAGLPPLDDSPAYAMPGVHPDGDGPGWALAGTLGAAAWGAPVAIGSGYPPDFYVPSVADLRQATLRLGEASRFDERACTVAVAATPLVCANRFDRPVDPWGHFSVAHGLFAALDLAQDQARGGEILSDWKPGEFTRVW